MLTGVKSCKENLLLQVHPRHAQINVILNTVRATQRCHLGVCQAADLTLQAGQHALAKVCLHMRFAMH